MVSNYRRQQKRSIDPENPLLTSLPGLDDNPARDKEEASLWSQINSLPEQQRLPLILRCLHGLAVPEIARILSKSPRVGRKTPQCSSPQA